MLLAPQWLHLVELTDELRRAEVGRIHGEICLEGLQEQAADGNEVTDV
jgi:hypothetical protein